MNLKMPLFIVLLISTFANAQETMSIKDSKPYPATENYTFICEKYVYTGEANVQIAKTEKGGVLKLTIQTTNDKTRISGGLYVDLVNGDVIPCTDKNSNESVAGKTSTYYYFTPAEMNKLKKTDIKAVRFIVKGNSSAFGDQTGYFTASSKTSYFSTAFDKSKKTFNTAAAISAL
ncbi:hypothetical protein BC749_1076 [Flavobacterium araucananum]|jgi:hypothetical protein|uniref:Uncharacterized protein n=1 Tax=Flavobacterium araucananum TaxID=946678 RepID=A0A227NM91_9FLAO|nr:hypothetical protein [Flavobacterium araucananum]OXE98635.1 hypothetical protein B0A64_22310 [Flavobacterium araucananum]PWJ97211.1 hypothetical protein BC749_1076 [Flavobacterium araucananum]